MSRISRRPGLNVLLITIDTLRADALGAYGNTESATPWMDRLAAAGVRFTNARAHNVVTLPTHASILTGVYPQEHGLRDNAGFRFSGDRPTLASVLRQQGYRTGAFISAFPLDSRFGLDYGFDVYDDSFVGAQSPPAFLEQERPGAETVALAQRWIESQGDGRWFAWVHLYEPHVPYAAPEPFAGRFQSDPYLGDVAAADAALAPLLEPLLEGSSAPTLVVLTSDHGESLGEHEEATHGIFAYDATLRVPLIFHQPDVLGPEVVEDSVRQIDIVTTVLDVLVIPVPTGVRGRSLLPLAAGAAEGAAPPVYFEALSGQLNRGWAPLYGVVDGNTKYIDLPIPELYDLSTDPRESTNLAADRPERVEEMRQVLAPLRTLDPGSAPGPEDLETLRRLESLGYITGQASDKARYTEDDDPKLLMDLDRSLQDIAGLYAAGNLTAALREARDLVERRPGMRMALMELAQLERESGNLDRGIEALREALALRPGDPETLALLAAYLTQADRAAEAIELTEPQARRSDPDLEVLLVRALALARSQRGQEAFDTVVRARDVDPLHPAVPVHFGTLFLMAGDRDRARQAFHQALTLNPDTVAALTALGVMEAEDGATEESVEYWRRATAMDPGQYRRLLTFARHLVSSGHVDKARPLLDLFLDSAPPDLFGREIEQVRQFLASSG